MASSYFFFVLLCLTSGLWMGANTQTTQKDSKCCKRCPPGWTRRGEKRYMFRFTGKDWADAEASCVAIGENLASVHSKEQDDFIKVMVKTATGADTRVWIGGDDEAKEGVWLWSDGFKFDFTFWATREPNNNSQGAENCLEMNFNGLPNDTCTEKKPSICAMRL